MNESIVKSDFIDIALDTNPAAIYLARLAPRSRRVQGEALNIIASMLTTGKQDAFSLQWWMLRYQHVSAVKNRLSENYAPATVNRMLAALKGVLLECRRLDLMTPDDYTKATDIKGIKSETLPPGRALTHREISALMQVCIADNSPAGYRDAALIAIARAGLRRSEITGLNIEYFDPINTSLTVRGGKGRKDRITYLPPGGVRAVSDWVKLRGTGDGALLNPVDKYDRILPRRLSDQSVLVILRKRALEAGIEKFNPHDFRRTFISDLLDSGIDIVTVQKLAGHASPETTSRYDRRGEDSKRAAMQMLELPYRR